MVVFHAREWRNIDAVKSGNRVCGALIIGLRLSPLGAGTKLVDGAANPVDIGCPSLPLHWNISVSDNETLKTYAQKASTYADLVQDTVEKDALFAAFLAALPNQSHVLDLGCGPGHFAAAIAARGHSVTASDAVQEMVDLASKHDGVQAQLATFDDITGDDIYDGIWANFSLLHAPREAMPAHLAALRKALKPKGAFHIALKLGTGSKRDGIGRQYTYYTEAELEALLTDAGFNVTNRTHGREKGLDGVEADWIALSTHD